MKTKYYISISQYVAANSDDMLARRTAFLENERSINKTRVRGKQTELDIAWASCLTFGACIKPKHASLTQYASELQVGIDPATGLNVGRNLLYVLI